MLSAMPAASWPERYLLADVRLAAGAVEAMPAGVASSDGMVPADILIDGGRILAIAPPGTIREPALARHEVRGGLVLPRFADIHTHLDKGFIWARRPNPDGTFAGALTSATADREARWSAGDVRRRMEFGLACALAHGTGAIRTHLDSDGKQAAISWPLFEEIRAEWRDRIALQAAAIFAVDMAVDEPQRFEALVGHVVRARGLLGGVSYLGRAPDAKLRAALRAILGAAERCGLDVDFHVDESADSEARTLEAIADETLALGFSGRVVAGHCCSLALMADADRDRVIGKLARAGIAVVSLPMCNMYLQDRRAGRTPRWRGVAPVHELAAAGVPALIASDNTRDPFHAYGDLDMLEVLREATRILHLDHAGFDSLDLLAAAPGRVMGIDGWGRIAEGGPADIVVTSARTLNELNARPQADRIVLLAGRPIDTTPPDYRVLDDLMA